MQTTLSRPIFEFFPQMGIFWAIWAQKSEKKTFLGQIRQKDTHLKKSKIGLIQSLYIPKTYLCAQLQGN